MAKKIRVRKHAVVLNRSAGGDTVISIVLCIMAVVMFLPMWYLIITAFKPAAELAITPPKFYVLKPTFQQFIDLFTNVNITWVPMSRYLFNTIFISLSATFGSLLIGSLTAYALSKIRMPGYKIVLNLITYSMMIGSVISGLVDFFVFAWLGMFNTYWISIVPQWVGTVGLYLMKNFIDANVSEEMLEAARIDGASEWTIFMKIALPMIKPAWLTTLALTFQTAWNTGSSAYVWSEQLKTFNVAISTISGGSTAGTVLMMSVPIIVFVVNQSKIVETMGSSGMKS